MFVGVPQPALTAAAWTEAEYATATFSAGRIDPPTSFMCEVNDFVIDGVLQQAIRFRWTAPGEPSLAPDRYTIVLTPESGFDPPRGTWSTAGPKTELFIPTRHFVLRRGTSETAAFSRLGATWTSVAAAETPKVFVTSTVLGVLVECG